MALGFFIGSLLSFKYKLPCNNSLFFGKSKYTFKNLLYSNLSTLTMNLSVSQASKCSKYVYVCLQV